MCCNSRRVPWSDEHDALAALRHDEDVVVGIIVQVGVCSLGAVPHVSFLKHVAWNADRAVRGWMDGERVSAPACTENWRHGGNGNDSVYIATNLDS